MSHVIRSTCYHFNLTDYNFYRNAMIFAYTLVIFAVLLAVLGFIFAKKKVSHGGDLHPKEGPADDFTEAR